MKKILLSAAAVSAAIPAAQAQITHYDIAPDQAISPVPALPHEFYIDLDDGDFDTSPITGWDVRFDYTGSETPYVFSTGSWRLAGGYSDPFHYTTGYAAGASLAFSNLVPSDTYARLDLDWPNDTDLQTYYFALRNTGDSREAWVAGVYDNDGDGFLVQSFAVAPGSANMTAGQTPVPEPAETAAVMALLAGSAALYHRRRKQAQCRAA